MVSGMFFHSPSGYLYVHTHTYLYALNECLLMSHEPQSQRLKHAQVQAMLMKHFCFWPLLKFMFVFTSAQAFEAEASARFRAPGSWILGFGWFQSWPFSPTRLAD